MFLLLKLLKSFHSYYVLIIGGLLFLLFAQHNELQKRSIAIQGYSKAYSNPDISESVREVKIKGPVRIEYRTIREYVPGKTEVVEKIVYRESEKTTKDNRKETKVVLPGLGHTRTSRFLLGVSNRNMEWRDHEDYTAWAGYSFFNRVDVLGGVQTSKSPDFSVQVIGRF